MTIEGVIIQNEAASTSTYEVTTDYECFCQTARIILDGIFDTEPPLATIFEKALEKRLIAQCGDDQDIPNLR